jgi:hypothetical protein
MNRFTRFVVRHLVACLVVLGLLLMGLPIGAFLLSRALTPKVVAAEPEKKPEPKPEPKPAVAVTADIKVGGGPVKAETKAEAKDGSGSVTEVHASATTAIEGVSKADNASLVLKQKGKAPNGYTVSQSIDMAVGKRYKKTSPDGSVIEILGNATLPEKAPEVKPAAPIKIEPIKVDVTSHVKSHVKVDPIEVKPVKISVEPITVSVRPIEVKPIVSTATIKVEGITKTVTVEKWQDRCTGQWYQRVIDR